jgi:hypothetical protein
MDDAPIDRDRLTELEDEIGAEDLRLVLEMFLEEAAAAVAALADRPSATEHAKSMHFLRSGALNLGLAGLAAEARRIAALPEADRRAAWIAPPLTAAIAAGRDALDATLTA